MRNHGVTLLLRKLHDNFDTTDGCRFCLFYQPLENSIYNTAQIYPDQILTKYLLRSTLCSVLVALDYLHREAHLIHSGAYSKSIFVTLAIYIRSKRILADSISDIQSRYILLQIEDRYIL